MPRRRAGPALFCGLWAVFSGFPRHKLAQPLAMMSPGPTAGYRALGHGPDRTAHPDRRVDMHDPHADRSDRRDRMYQHGNAFLFNRGVGVEVLIPHHQAARYENDDEDRHRPEDNLLTGIVFADLG